MAEEAKSAEKEVGTEEKQAVKKGHEKKEPESKDTKQSSQKIKKGDFVEIEYIGKVRDGDIVFDTTDEKSAKKYDIFNPNAEYRPRIICVGQGYIVRGIDKELEGKEIGKEYLLELKPDEAFGKKSVKLIQLISTNKFKKQGVQPQPGLQVNIDGAIGFIKTVSGGRTLVDFNHPLAGKDIIYKIKANSIIKDDAKKLRAILSMQLGLKEEEMDISVSEGNAVIKSEKIVLPEPLQEELLKHVQELIPSIKRLEFSQKTT